MSTRTLVQLCCAFLLVGSHSNTAFAWGQAGHQIIARTAVKVAQDRFNNPELTAAFLSNSDSLAALALVPDNQWKGGQPKEIVASLSPAHFLDIEFMTPGHIDLNTLPFRIGDASKLIMKLCPTSGMSDKLECKTNAPTDKILSATGSLPWRIGQMTDLLVESFKKVKQLQDSNASKDQIVQQVRVSLLYSGILAHFIGDMTQPLHITKNYDGGETSQKGVHSFFETKLIDAQPHGFDRQAYDYAMNAKPATTILNQAAATTDRVKVETWMPVEWSFMLSVESNKRMPTVLDMDRKFALIDQGNNGKPTANQGGKKSGLNMEVARRSPDEIAEKFNEILVQRIGIASDFLALVWHRAWVQGGSPNLSMYAPNDAKIGKIEPILLDYSNFL